MNVIEKYSRVRPFPTVEIETDEAGNELFDDIFTTTELTLETGTVTLTFIAVADNLLDEAFQFQDIDPTNPSLFPERLVSLRFTLAFE